jgi:HPt (histidine-containing phosphotransfer) domain-containing protein
MEKNTKPLKLEYLDEISAGDIQFKKDLIKIFLNQIPEFISNMKKFYADNDLKALAKEAHTAKSSVLIFGMEETGASLKKLQLLAEENTPDPITEIIQSVELELENMSKLLLEFIQS